MSQQDHLHHFKYKKQEFQTPAHFAQREDESAKYNYILKDMQIPLLNRMGIMIP